MQGASRESLASLRGIFVTAVDGLDDAALRRLSEDLFAIVTLFATQGSLRRAVSDPGLTSDAKTQVVDGLLTGKVSSEALTIARGTASARWSRPGDVVDALEALAVEAALTGAEVEGTLDEVEDELFRFERIIDSAPQLRAALTDRTLPAERKRELVHRLLDGKAAAVTTALVERAVVAPRGRTIERVLEEFIGFAAGRRSRLVARVTTAVALDGPQLERLAAALAAEFGREVRLQVVIDPSLVGGITVRVGDELIDASVARQLDAAHRRLTGR